MTARVVTTREAADALASGTVVHSDAGTIACVYNDTLAVVFGNARPVDRALLALPLTVLWPLGDEDQPPEVGAGWTSPELRVVDTPAPVATSPSDTRVGDQTLRDEIAAALECCTCTPYPYVGPEEDCPMHGRAIYQADAVMPIVRRAEAAALMGAAQALEDAYAVTEIDDTPADIEMLRRLAREARP